MRSVDALVSFGEPVGLPELASADVLRLGMGMTCWYLETVRVSDEGLSVGVFDLSLLS